MKDIEERLKEIPTAVQSEKMDRRMEQLFSSAPMSRTAFLFRRTPVWVALAAGLIGIVVGTLMQGMTASEPKGLEGAARVVYLIQPNGPEGRNAFDWTPIEDAFWDGATTPEIVVITSGGGNSLKQRGAVL